MKTQRDVPFHVYAVDGFESAHRTEAAAIRYAKRRAKLRGVLYTVVKCSLRRYTAGAYGTEIWASNGRHVAGEGVDR